MLGDDRADAVRVPHQLAPQRSAAARKERTMDRRRETGRERGVVIGIGAFVLGRAVLMPSPPSRTLSAGASASGGDRP